MKIEFVEPELPCPGAVAVGVWEEGVLTPAARKLDGMTGGALARALSVSPRFRGRKEDLLTVVAPQGVPASRIVLAGLGKPAAMDARLLQDIGGLLVAHLNGTGEKEATLAIDLDAAAGLGEAEAAAELAFGARLRSYRFDRYKTREKPEQKASLRRPRRFRRATWPPTRSSSRAISSPNPPTSSTPRRSRLGPKACGSSGSALRSSTRQQCARSA